MHELVKTHCIHEDCRYRGTFDFQPACMFLMYTGQLRGCKISECTRYKTGKLKRESQLGGFWVNDI